MATQENSSRYRSSFSSDRVSTGIPHTVADTSPEHHGLEKESNEHQLPGVFARPHRQRRTSETKRDFWHRRLSNFLDARDMALRVESLKVESSIVRITAEQYSVRKGKEFATAADLKDCLSSVDEQCLYQFVIRPYINSEGPLFGGMSELYVLDSELQVPPEVLFSAFEALPDISILSLEKKRYIVVGKNILVVPKPSSEPGTSTGELFVSLFLPDS
jgi:hypothetical protein